MEKNKLVLYYILFPLWLFHVLCLWVMKKENRMLLSEDLTRYGKFLDLPYVFFDSFVYLISSDKYFRSVFYYRLGRSFGGAILSKLRPGCVDLNIPRTVKIGGGLLPDHPYATFLNAESIGKNFTIMQCTTIGMKNNKKPTIGDNVTVGANACVIGGVKIGNNVMIGAGSVVVKDIPDKSVAVGNPARVIKKL